MAPDLLTTNRVQHMHDLASPHKAHTMNTYTKYINHLILTTCTLLGACTHQQPQPTSTKTTLKQPDELAPPSQDWPKEDHFVVTIKTTHEQGDVRLNVHGYQPNYAVDWDNDGVFDEHNLTTPTTHTYGDPGEYTIRIAGSLPHIVLCSDQLAQYGGYQLVPIDTQQVQDLVQWGKTKWSAMYGMFAHCKELSTWSATDKPVLAHTKNMSSMFLDAEKFNQPLEGWDTSSVVDMSAMFMGATSFDQPINTWDVSQVLTMVNMFSLASSFNQPLDTWNVSSVTDMTQMFSDAEVFNQPLEQWNVSNVTNMSFMFSNTKAFNQPLEKWNTSNVTQMAGMFQKAEAFNQPLNGWNVSNVNLILFMFGDATQFNQPLDKWNISNVRDLNFIFHYATSLSTENYDTTLIGWSELPSLPSNINLNAEGVHYCNSQAARDILVKNHHWKITDAGQKCP